MDNGLTLDDIGAGIDELVRALGMAEAPPQAQVLPSGTNNPEKCVTAIAAHLRLPVKINLSYVAATDESHEGDRFETRQVVLTDSRGRGSASVTAQVLIPGNLPIYGVSALTDFPIDVRISENGASQPYTFTTIMAHEMSHILLHSVRHPEANNEFYADLTPMVLGFSAIIAAGRKVTSTIGGSTTSTREIRFGYLTDEQFAFARDKIEGMLAERRRARGALLATAKRLQMDRSRARRVLLRFGRLMGCLDAKRPRRMGRADALKIPSFHQAGYTHEAEEAIRVSGEAAVHALDAWGASGHYSDRDPMRMEADLAAITRAAGLLSPLLASLEQDSKALRRHVGLAARIRIAWEVRRAAVDQVRR